MISFLISIFLCTRIIFGVKFLVNRGVLLDFSVGESIIKEVFEDKIFEIEGGKVYFMETQYESVFLSSNGFVELSNNVSEWQSFHCNVVNITNEDYYPRHTLIAPFCDDLATRIASQGERIYYRSSGSIFDVYSEIDFETLNEFINDNYMSQYVTSEEEGGEENERNALLFSTDWFMTATFDRVSVQESPSGDRISFQMTIATDYTLRESFFIVQYPKYKHPIFANFIGIVRSDDYFSVLRYSEDVENFSRGSNVGIQGTYVIRLSAPGLSLEEHATCNGDPDLVSCSRPSGKCVVSYLEKNETECYVHLNETICEERRKIAHNISQVDNNQTIFGCECESYFFGDDCENKLKCDGIEADDESVCSFSGNCTENGNCTCVSGAKGEICDDFRCWGLEKDNSKVCSSNGVCRTVDTCDCIVLGKGGRFCNESACFGKEMKYSSSLPTYLFDDFEASELFVPDDEPFSSLLWTNGSNVNVTTGRIDTTYFDCRGEKGNFLHFYSNELADDKSERWIKSVLMQRGFVNLQFYLNTCSDIEKGKLVVKKIDSSEEITLKEVLYRYFRQPGTVQVSFNALKPFYIVLLQECDSNVCDLIVDSFKMSVIPDSEIPCGSNGDCLGEDQCDCLETYRGDQCEIPICFGKSSHLMEEIVCNNRGSCVGPDVCECSDFNWGGKECSDVSCYGIEASSNLVCSRHGKCFKNTRTIGKNFCCCESGYYGPFCDESVPSSFDNLDLRCFDSAGKATEWDYAVGAEFTYGNDKCGSLSGQAVWFNGNTARKLVSTWHSVGVFHLSFSFVLGNGKEHCMHSEHSEDVQIIIEEERYDRSNNPYIFPIVLETLEYNMYRNWTTVELRYAANKTHRIVVSQRSWNPDSDQWAMDWIRLFEIVQYHQDWWILIVSLCAFFLIVIFGSIIAVVLYYWIGQAKKKESMKFSVVDALGRKSFEEESKEMEMGKNNEDIQSEDENIELEEVGLLISSRDEEEHSTEKAFILKDEKRSDFAD